MVLACVACGNTNLVVPCESLSESLTVEGWVQVIHSLFHVAIKTRDLEASRRFYVNVLGMTVDFRPPIGFPGIWLRSPMLASAAIFHLYAGDAALEADGSYASGTAAIDHVSITAAGFQAYRERFVAYGLQWRANVVRDLGLWQLFVYDPSAVMLELTFSAAAEVVTEPEFAAEYRYRPRECFYRPNEYIQFSST